MGIFCVKMGDISECLSTIIIHEFAFIKQFLRSFVLFLQYDENL